MRELTVRLKFTSHCLGNVKKHYRTKGKLQHYFVLPRNPNGKIVFMPTWWLSTLRRAAEILCKHHKEVEKIRFALEVEGNPRPLPEFYKRYWSDSQFSKHEAFFPGDIISVTCVVPPAISDDDFLRLLNYAGKYCGMSPSQPNKFGFYEVESIRPTVPKQMVQQKALGDRDEVLKK